MSIRLDKEWSPLSDSERLPAQLGVFELGDHRGQILQVGYAGGRSRFGLRGAVAEAAQGLAAADRFRVEVTTAYLTRYRELLMAYVEDHCALPPANAPEPSLGRLTRG